ncbi:MerR family transcriptional regulator [Lentzea tibetensis]|uniref:MerR family transcriptional regulator n=1 Tax=Lentzea tibetensis TaxID=2591470 RepID=A0A563EQ94_9PSEU|nr:MerR family transcriptional regulator [Lentzea tibetensis]TWP49577.1 MerR family transcriptional regulator [Lentzea tibetensis]
MEMWTIGELAQASGLTIRTLHHYDEIGLVSASDRTDAGHRRYTEADLVRLYRVRGLRQLGLSLEEIAAALDSGDLRSLLTAQLAVLDVQANRIAEMRDQIRGLVDQPDAARMLKTLELMSVSEGFLSREQRDALASQRASLGAEKVDELRAEWLAVVQELRGHVVAGTPPDDPRVRELARRWAAVGQAFTTGDAQVGAQVNAMWEANRERLNEHLTSRIGWEGPGDMADVLEYLHRVPL